MFHLDNITLGSLCMLYHLCTVGSYEVVCYQMDKLTLSFFPWLFHTLCPGQSQSLGCNRNKCQLEVLRSAGPLLPAWSSSPDLRSAGPLLPAWSSSSALRFTSASLFFLTSQPLVLSSACMPLLHSLDSRNYISWRDFHWLTCGSRAALPITWRISVQTFYF